jgi:hypothetical protein
MKDAGKHLDKMMKALKNKTETKQSKLHKNQENLDEAKNKAGMVANILDGVKADAQKVLSSEDYDTFTTLLQKCRAIESETDFDEAKKVKDEVPDLDALNKAVKDLKKSAKNAAKDKAKKAKDNAEQNSDENSGDSDGTGETGSGTDDTGNTAVPNPETTSPAQDTDYVAQVTPNEGSATVDGDISDWNLEADFSANMCTAGSVGSDGNCAGSGKENLSDLYSRYDCVTNTIYVLVLENDSHRAEKSADDAWVTIGGKSNKVVKGSSGNNGAAPDFSWVENNSGRTIGYEASFLLEAGYVEVHLNVSNNTSSTGKNGDTMSITTQCN